MSDVDLNTKLRHFFGKKQTKSRYGGRLKRIQMNIVYFLVIHKAYKYI